MSDMRDKVMQIISNMNSALPTECLTPEQFELTNTSIAEAEQMFYGVLCGELSYRPRRRVSNPLFEKYAKEGHNFLHYLQMYENSCDAYCDNASEKKEFLYVEVEPDKLALIYVLDLYAKRVIASRSRWILKAIKEGEGSLKDMLSQLFGDYGEQPLRHRKKDPLKERRYTRLREFISQKFSKEDSKEDSKGKKHKNFPEDAFKATLISVVSGSTKTLWVKRLYTEYRKQKIWNKFVIEVNGKGLPEEQWNEYIYARGKKRIAIAEKYGFFRSKRYLEFFKKHRNILRVRKGFIKLLVKQLWPSATDKKIIEELQNAPKTNSK